MAGLDLAYPQSVTSVDAPMERLETLLARHHIRVAVGQSRWTGQTVIRLVDEQTGLPKGRADRTFGELLAELTSEFPVAGNQQK